MAPLPRVFVTRALPPGALEPLEGRAQIAIGPDGPTLDRAQLEEGVRGADALVSMLCDRIDASLLDLAPRLRIVANYASGTNNVDLKAAEERGIWVTNTPGATTDATADVAMALLLASARHLLEAERSLRAGQFGGWYPNAFLGVELSGSVLGIVGLGHIGAAVARRARAFGMRVLYSGRRRAPEPVEAETGASFRPLDELLRESDFVSLHCPLTEQTRRLIDARALGLMKPGAILVNTARGAVVDEAALAEALHAGRLGGAALDVYEEEPAVHPRLLTAPRTVLAPHIGTSTLRTRLAMARMAVGEVLRVLAGERPGHPVNRPSAPR